ncbi:MAG: hypothetical protein ACFHVJ_16255 [Aestuariibacter sp.]
MTNLIENYLTAVESHLTDNQEDILQELRSNIEATIEAKEEESDSTLSEAEIAEVLKRFGHPLKAASQFNEQQYLIGPGLYLPYLQVMKFSLFGVIGIQAIMMVVQRMIADGHSLSFTGLLSGIVETGIMVAIMVTLTFAVMEYYGQKLSWYSSWNPLQTLKNQRVAADRQDAITNVISDSVLFLWWNDWFGFKSVLPFPNDFPITASDIYGAVFLPVNILLIISLLFYSWQLLNNAWDKYSIAIAVVIDIATLVILGYMLSARNYFTTIESTPELSLMLERINFSASMIIIVIFGFVSYDLYKHLRCWIKLSK